MKKDFSFALSVLASLPLCAGVEISTDHTNAMYRCGEKAAFAIRVTDGAALMKTGEVAVVLDNFGTNIMVRQVFRLAEANPIVVAGTRNDPGFLRLKTSGAGGSVVWGVGYEPDRVRPVTQVPDDFDAFWTDARKKLAAKVPLDAQVTKVLERCTEKFDFYRISFATFGRRVHGFMSIPADKSRAPFPVSLSVAAAGFGDWTNNMGGQPDRIEVFFSVYPFEPNWKWKEMGLKSVYDAMNTDYDVDYACGRYCNAGAGVSREAYFYYPVILGIDRAIDWLAARPDVDASRIRYQGTSQGGGMGMILTGLNKRISRAAFFVPAITDTLATDAGRQSGWPQPLENIRRAEEREVARRVMPYFDAASFATRITCPVRFAVGLADTTCPPHCTWAAYNATASKDKRLFYGIGMGHGCRSEFYRALGQWLRGAADREPVVTTLTFDDDAKDFATIVSPMLGKYGWKGIFNVIVDRIGGKTANLTWDDVRAIRDAGHEIADHSLSHPDLVRLLQAGDTNEVRRQVFASRDAFARELGRKPDWFCFPYNGADDACRRIVADAGMRPLACNRTNFGHATPARTEKGAYVRLLADLFGNARHVDLMVHGVTRGHGYEAFEDADQFEDFLREIRALEDEGFIRVTPYSEAYKAEEPK